MVRLWLTLGCLFLAGSVSLADGYYLASDGYYYDSAGYAYTRQRYETYGYWRCGRYYPGSYYYTYQRYYAPQPTVVKVEITPPVYKFKEWKAEMVQYAEQLDDHDAFERAANAIGMYRQRSFQQGYSYGAQPVNATTQYGYNQQVGAYQDNSLALFVQGAAQHVNNAIGASERIATGYQAMGGTNLSRINEILAQGHSNAQTLAATAQVVDANARFLGAVAAALKAPTPQGVAIQGYSFGLDSNGQVTRNDSAVPQQTRAEVSKLWQESAKTRCAACHSGATKKGGFDVSTYPGLSIEKKRAVWSLLTTNDPAKMMPRDPTDTSKPGTPLAPEELKFWLYN